VAAIALLVIASLSGAAAQPRTVLGWQLEHFLGYFVATLIVCLAWSRPLLVAAALMLVAVLLEGLQALTPDRHPNLVAALCGAGGVVVAALLAELFIRARRRRPMESRKADPLSNLVREVEGDRGAETRG
jgi:VanZ family protein